MKKQNKLTDAERAMWRKRFADKSTEPTVLIITEEDDDRYAEILAISKESGNCFGGFDMKNSIFEKFNGVL